MRKRKNSNRCADLSLVCVRNLVILFLLTSCFAVAETGEAAWLRYAPLDAKLAQQYTTLPTAVTVLDNSELLATAQSELIRGVRGMLGMTL